MAKRYCIRPFYRARTSYTHYDDSGMEDEWQLEVYLHALGLLKKYDYKSVIDIGCGAGYKLACYFDGYETLGLELPVNVEILKKKYPHMRWEVSDFSVPANIETDVVVCSDVIEHLIDPDEIIDYIKTISYKYLVMSTPDRNLLHKPYRLGYYGPPRNKAHTREWNQKEFAEYLGQHFEVVDQRVTNLGQRTQMVICTPK